MKCLNSDEDIINVKGDVRVHFLRSKSLLGDSLCFTESDNISHLIFRYTVLQGKNTASCLLPTVIKHGEKTDISWEDNGVISIEDNMEDSKWQSTVYCFTVTPTQFVEYQKWLIVWISNNRKYTIFDGGSTNRKYLSESLQYIAGQSLNHSNVPLFFPETITYGMNYANKEKCSNIDIQEITKWYSEAQSELRESAYFLDVVAFINKSKYIYYHEEIDGRDTYWLVNSPSLYTVSKKIKPSGLRETRSKSVNQAESSTNATSDPEPPALFPIIVSGSKINPSSRSGIILVVVILFTVVILAIIIAVAVYDSHEKEKLTIPTAQPTTPIVAII